MQTFYMGELPPSAYSQELSPKDLCGFIKEKLKGIVHNIPLELLRSIYEIVENIDKQTISYMDWSTISKNDAFLIIDYYYIISIFYTY